MTPETYEALFWVLLSLTVGAGIFTVLGWLAELLERWRP